MSNRKPSAPGKPSKATIQKRAAAQRAMAAASGKRAERRRRLTMVLSPIAVVILVVVVFVAVKATTSGDDKGSEAHKARPALATAVTHVPPAVFDKVGKQSVSGPTRLLTGAPLVANDKPKVLYVGADWCPYCAAERWALAAALSRFGTFSDLWVTKSSPADSYPNTATLSFGHSDYSSGHITGAIKDVEDGEGNQLDELTDAERQTWIEATGKGSFPYINIGGKYQFGIQYDPAVLEGMTHAQIARAMSNPNSKAGRAIIGSANVLTAAICDVTDGKPAKVCSSKAVTAAKPLLNAGSDQTKDESKATGSAGG